VVKARGAATAEMVEAVAPETVTVWAPARATRA
jgi:hypothetical protein